VLLEADGYNRSRRRRRRQSAEPVHSEPSRQHRRLKLDVQRIVRHYPADNRVVTLAELTKWVGRPVTH